MKAACTILIPTHNRARYLDRVVRWFGPFGCPIVIADSSTVEWTSPLRAASNTTYLHWPGGFEVYLAKLVAAFARVETPLVAMCADDDFITCDGLAASVAFLEGNPDYSFSQGYAYTFQRFGRRIVTWPMIYDHHTRENESWLERVEGPLDTVYYGVNRTDVLRTSFEFLARQDFSQIMECLPGFVDFAITSYAARRGKFQRQAIPFGLREYSPLVSAVRLRPNTITSRNVPDFYANLLRLIADGDPDTGVAARLRRTFSADYAGQIMYDLTAPGSRKGRVAALPEAVRSQVELVVRLATAARIYARPAYRPFRQVYACPDYTRFKSMVLEDEVS